MSRDYSVFIEDMLTAIDRVADYTRDMDFERFSGDPKTIDAVVRNLEIVGEAAKTIPEPMRKRYPQIPWKRLAGLRDILIHQYFGIDVSIVWDVVQNKLPALRDPLQEIVESEP